MRESERAEQSGGRPARLLEVDGDYGVVAAVDIGERHSQIMLCSLDPRVLTRRAVIIALAAGPVKILSQLAAIIDEMVAGHEGGRSRLVTVGLALPAPVDYVAGMVTGYSVLQGWDGFDTKTWLEERLGVPVLVENDVNAMAVAEKAQYWPEADSLFYVKVGTGIGSAIFTNGRLYHGAQGAAGDIGHSQVHGHGEPLCRCGNRGCVEALTAGWAIVRDLNDDRATDTSAIVRLANAGDPDVLAALRAGGRRIGEAIASATSLLNPEVIVIGGSVAAAGELILSGVRQMVYDRVLPLATRRLHLVPARVGADGTTLGAARLAVAAWFEHLRANAGT
ncbi:ROK family protein [Tessaracoccus sp. MC1756]|uniref:ROK family protein n=1 Tax=Tessaracoccus sp. MC1756 TaxID=2760311 RepID=UPI001601E60E|nr:ROK family protein [Tessaracoccus sp. MC1756]